MKQFMVIAMLLFSNLLFSQDIKTVEKGIKSLKDSFASMDKQAAKLDSMNADIAKRIELQRARIDSAEIANMTARSANAWAQLSRDRNREAKKKMWMYFGFAAVGIVILIIGLKRKVKPKQ